MATIKVRHLVCRPGAAGALPRWFWQPSSKLRAQGWRPERVPADWRRYDDADHLQAAAIAAAEQLNRRLDGARDAEALASRPAPPAPIGRTLGELVATYEASREFAGLRDTTRRSYRQSLRKLEVWGGDTPLRAIDPVRVQHLLDALEATPSYANAVVRVLRLVLAWGRRKGWVTVNAAEAPKLASTAAAGIIWPHGAPEAFAAVADRMRLASIGTAVLLNEWLGQREADILRMPRSVHRRGNLVLRQAKTGAAVSLPIDMVPHLKARLEAALAIHTAREAAGKPAVTTILIAEATGQPWRSDHFRHEFARVRAQLAKTHPYFDTDHLLPGRDMTDPDAYRIATTELTFMRLRHTAVTRLAEAGCDVPLIASVTGHAEASVVPLLKRYMIRTAAIARLAFQRRLDAEANSTATPESDKKSDTV